MTIDLSPEAVRRVQEAAAANRAANQWVLTPDLTPTAESLSENWTEWDEKRKAILTAARADTHMPTGSRNYDVAQWLAARGHSPDTLARIDTIRNQWDHGGGTPVQDAARQAVLDHLQAGDDVGRALSDQITMQTEAARAWLDGQQDRIQAIHDRRDRDRSDLENERIWRATGKWPGDDTGEAGEPPPGAMPDHQYEARLATIEANHEHALSLATDTPMLYRRGEPQAVSAWTTDPEGANTSPLTTNRRIEPDHAVPLPELLQTHNILGAWGAPGEHEVTLIRRDAMNTLGEALSLELEEAGQHTGAMIALYPTEQDRQDLALDGDGDESPDELHVTLAMLGKAADVPDPDQLKQDVSDWATRTPPLNGEISGHGLFTAGDTPVTYLTPDLPELPAAHADLVSVLKKHGHPVSEQHGFSPHMTLSYHDRTSKLPDHGGRKIKFTHATVVLGDQHHHYKLVGSPGAKGTLTA